MKQAIAKPTAKPVAKPFTKPVAGPAARPVAKPFVTLNTKPMPYSGKPWVFLIGILLALGFFLPAVPASEAPKPLQTYYIRYDIKTEHHRLTDETLLMIPAENEFRGMEFSAVSWPGVISVTPGESKNRLLVRARDWALKTILMEQGLKSVNSRDLVTVVSYEGVVRTPVRILPSGAVTDRFSFTAETRFSPLAFPDQWRNLKIKRQIRERLNNMLRWFE